MVRRMATLAIVVATVGVGLVLAAPSAGACSCVGLDDVEALRTSQVAFVGELLEVRTPPGLPFSSADPERFVFAVDVVYKGEAKATQSVVTAREGASCGLELAGPGPFLVFATTSSEPDLQAEDGELFSSLCSGSRALAAGPVPASFGTGARPDAGSAPIGDLGDDPVSDPSDDGASVSAVVAAGGLLLLAVLVVASLVWRGRRRREAAVAA